MTRDRATADDEHNTDFFLTGQTTSPVTSRKREGIFTHIELNGVFSQAYILMSLSHTNINTI